MAELLLAGNLGDFALATAIAFPCLGPEPLNKRGFLIFGALIDNVVFAHLVIFLAGKNLALYLKQLGDVAVHTSLPFVGIGKQPFEAAL